jgi:ADP-heptose:LPS heptosyltransferase
MTRRVLIHRPGSLGDTVVALPCLRLVRRTFPDAELRVLTNAPVARSAPPLAAVLEGTGLVDGYLEYPIGTRSLSKLWRLAREIRRWRPELLVYLARRESLGQAWRDAAFFRACGIGRIVGIPLTHGLLLNRRQPDGTFEREAARLARNMTSLGTVDLADRSVWNLGLADTDRALPRRLVAEHIGSEPFIAISLGTKQPANDWAWDDWRTVAERLCRLYPHRLVFIGAEEDRAPSDAVMEGLGAGAVNFCGRLTVRESAALIEAAALFVGHDSGPMHLAAAVETPLVAVFSRLWQPGIWYPLGLTAAILYPLGDSVQSIAPAAVMEAIRSLLPMAAASNLVGEP